MTLQAGKVATATVELVPVPGEEGELQWYGVVVFPPELMPMELVDGVTALDILADVVKKTRARMIQEAMVTHARKEALEEDVASGRVKPS